MVFALTVRYNFLDIHFVRPLLAVYSKRRWLIANIITPSRVTSSSWGPDTSSAEISKLSQLENDILAAQLPEFKGLISLSRDLPEHRWDRPRYLGYRRTISGIILSGILFMNMTVKFFNLCLPRLPSTAKLCVSCVYLPELKYICQQPVGSELWVRGEDFPNTLWIDPEMTTVISYRPYCHFVSISEAEILTLTGCETCTVRHHPVHLRSQN